MSASFPVSIYRGVTMRKVFRFMQPSWVYRPITGIQNSAPCRVSCPAHGIPPAWPFAIENANGMKAINTRDDSYIATVIDADTIDINSLDSLAFPVWTSGGVVKFHPNVDMDGMTATSDFRSAVGAPGDPLIRLSSSDGSIILDNAAGTITLNIAASITAGLIVSKGVYDVKLTDSLGNVSYIPVSPFTVADTSTKS